MHHVGLPRSPFQQRQHIKGSPSTPFGFSSPILNHAFSPTRDDSLTPKLRPISATSSTGVSSASEALQSVVGDNATKEDIVERLYGLIAKFEDDDLKIEDDAIGQVTSEVRTLESTIERLSIRGKRHTISSAPELGHSKERMTLDEIRKSEEDSYLWEVSPGELQKVRVKIEKQRKAKQRKREQDDVDSDLSSRSSKWGQESSRASSISASGSVEDESTPATKEPDLKPHQANVLTKEAQELSTRLLSALTELQQRKGESDEIHDLLVQRCEASTERILLLEYRIAEMEDDFSANASELKFLRLQLQAIEAQCAPYIARDSEEDAELAESIMNWKIDWEEVNRRSMARRGRKDVVVPPRVVRGASAEVPLRRTFSQHGVRIGADNG